ncbi:MAG: SlyX family protein, partial [Planctomycetaceae bacterium]
IMDQTDLDRFVRLETLCAHMQHDVEQMHQVLLAVQNDMKTLRLQLNRIQSQVADAQDGEGTRDPQSERPPHY